MTPDNSNATKEKGDTSDEPRAATALSANRGFNAFIPWQERGDNSEVDDDIE